MSVQDKALFSNIEGNLWMGATPAYSQGAPQFSFIVDCFGYPYTVFDFQRRMVVAFDDGPIVPDTGLLERAAAVVNEMRARVTTLVHCQAGMNRSGLIVALALIIAGRTARQAIDLIREKRSPGCLFNKAFEEFLLAYERPG